MDTGKLTPQGAVEYDGWEKIYEYEISASDTEAQLLATFQGADGDTSGSADTGQTMTFAGTAQLDTAQAKIGNSSLLLDGSGDYVSIPDSDDWYFGSGDFTIDCWVNIDTLTLNNFLHQYVDSNNFFRFDITSDGEIRYQFRASGSFLVDTVTSGAGVTIGEWAHIALIRNGNDLYFCKDGSIIETVDVTGVSLTHLNRPLIIGELGAGDFDGHIDALRITKGTALWTSNFTPPTTIDDYVSTSAITIFGLEGDTDEQYMLDVSSESQDDTGGLKVLCNGDSGLNYGYQELAGGNSTISANRVTGTNYFLRMAYSASGSISHARALIYAKSGYPRTALVNLARNVSGTTVNYIINRGHSWNNTTDEITSLTINQYNSSTVKMSVGTVISLYRRISS